MSNVQYTEWTIEEQVVHSGIDQNLPKFHDTSSSLSLTSMKKLVGFDPSHTVQVQGLNKN